MSTSKYDNADLFRQCFTEREGVLYWVPRPLDHFTNERTMAWWNKRYSGNVAGCVRKGSADTRWVVRLNDELFYRYRIIWVMHYGHCPDVIDHINRLSTDDRITNLRAANQSGNLANSKVARNNTSGIKGVTWYRRDGKWAAQIVVRGKRLHLGYFELLEEAAAARAAAATMHFGVFSNG